MMVSISIEEAYMNKKLIAIIALVAALAVGCSSPTAKETTPAPIEAPVSTVSETKIEPEKAPIVETTVDATPSEESPSDEGTVTTTVTPPAPGTQETTALATGVHRFGDNASAQSAYYDLDFDGSGRFVLKDKDDRTIFDVAIAENDHDEDYRVYINEGTTIELTGSLSAKFKPSDHKLSDDELNPGLYEVGVDVKEGSFDVKAKDISKEGGGLVIYSSDFEELRRVEFKDETPHNITLNKEEMIVLYGVDELSFK